jgi:hypothetical protein
MAARREVKPSVVAERGRSVVAGILPAVESGVPPGVTRVNHTARHVPGTSPSGGRNLENAVGNKKHTN